MISANDDYIRPNLRIIAYENLSNTLAITSLHDSPVRVNANQDIYRIPNLTGPVNRPISFAVVSQSQYFLLKPKFKSYPSLIIFCLPDKSEIRKPANQCNG